MLNRDKEKKFFKAEQISMKTTKQVDFTGERVPYERIKKNRPATSYGPFISSTSYGNTFQAWDATGYVPTLKPRENLQSTTNMPFKAVSSYRDTFKTMGGGRPGTEMKGANAGYEQGDGLGSAKAGSAKGNNAKSGANQGDVVVGGKNRHQKSQISILSSPDKKVPFMKDTTNRVEFRGQKSIERSRPIKHADNLGNVELKVDSRFFSTSYRTNFNEFNNADACNRETERVTKRRELKQLQ